MEALRRPTDFNWEHLFLSTTSSGLLAVVCELISSKMAAGRVASVETISGVDSHGAVRASIPLVGTTANKLAPHNSRIERRRGSWREKPVSWGFLKQVHRSSLSMWFGCKALECSHQKKQCSEQGNVRVAVAVGSTCSISGTIVLYKLARNLKKV